MYKGNSTKWAEPSTENNPYVKTYFLNLLLTIIDGILHEHTIFC